MNEELDQLSKSYWKNIIFEDDEDNSVGSNDDNETDKDKDNVDSVKNSGSNARDYQPPKDSPPWTYLDYAEDKIISDLEKNTIQYWHPPGQDPVSVNSANLLPCYYQNVWCCAWLPFK